MYSTNVRARALTTIAALAGLAALAATLLAHTPQIAIIRTAAGIGQSAQGLEGFVKTCGDLVTPLLVAAAAATPLATIGGAVAMAFGSRKGLQIILTSLGILAVLGSVTGIVK
jgi:hypothetical protein